MTMKLLMIGLLLWCAISNCQAKKKITEEEAKEYEALYEEIWNETQNGTFRGTIEVEMLKKNDKKLCDVYPGLRSCKLSKTNKNQLKNLSKKYISEMNNIYYSQEIESAEVSESLTSTLKRRKRSTTNQCQQSSATFVFLLTAVGEDGITYELLQDEDEKFFQEFFIYKCANSPPSNMNCEMQDIYVIAAVYNPAYDYEITVEKVKLPAVCANVNAC